MKYCFEDLKNIFDFFLRCHITFTRKNYKETLFKSEKVLTNNEQNDLYKSLEQKYDLNLLNNLNEVNFLTNLYYLEIFNKYIQPTKTKNIRILDIGSKNWNYVKSEYIFFKTLSDNLTLNGIEIDAYRLCTNLYNRAEIAKFYIKNLSCTNYIIGDFMNHNEKYDYIIWILPFITEYPHIKWGLPLKYFKPEQMLNHAYNILNDGGELLIINQGENEYAVQKELIQNLNLTCEFIGEINNAFNPYKNKRFCSKIIKK